jgi:type II secretory pathway component GspD/PulD (secretin)
VSGAFEPMRTAAVRWTAAALFTFAAAPLTAQVPEVRPEPTGTVQLDFQDLDFAYVVSALARAAGLNLIYHDLPAKPITLRTAEPVPRADLPVLIRTLAAANGVAVTEDAGFLRLVGAGEAELHDTRELYIYRLRHARAAQLGSTLHALFGGGPVPTTQTGMRPPLSQQLRELQAPPTTAQPAQPSQGIVISTRDGAGMEGGVLIVPEEVTNSLLVRATSADWVIVEQAISALDLRPLQVVIEVLIAEVRHTDEIDVGVSFQGVRETATGWGEVVLPPRPGTPEDAFTLQGVRFGGVDVQATLSALAATGEVRILARPVVLAQNNQEARILVGTQQPFVQFSQILPSDPVGARFETVQYREVGTVLAILPTINEDGYVNLAVAQEVSSATTETQFGAPIISTREAETQLLARNGQTVVLGGLVDQQVDRVRQGIPLLMDIPVLGHLFSSTRETTGNSELFLFLTPYIVATDQDADLLREFIEEERDLLRPFLPGAPLTPPVLFPPPGGDWPPPGVLEPGGAPR